MQKQTQTWNLRTSHWTSFIKTEKYKKAVF